MSDHWKITYKRLGSNIIQHCKIQWTYKQCLCVHEKYVIMDFTYFHVQESFCHDYSLEVPRHSNPWLLQQLWSPLKVGEIQKLDLLQWHFIKRMKNYYSSDYWSSLSDLNLLSLERRRERYQIIYLWKIIENIVPNPCVSINGIEEKSIDVRISPRNGRFCIQPNISRHCSTKLQNLCFASFCIHGCKLFNILPNNVRGVTKCTSAAFKSSLDKFLELIPDTPHLPGLGKYCQAQSNSLIHTVPLYYI